MKRSIRIAALALALATCSARGADAGYAITYTFTGLATGYVGDFDNTFTATPLTVTLVGDSSRVDTSQAPFESVIRGFTSITYEVGGMAYRSIEPGRKGLDNTHIDSMNGLLTFGTQSFVSTFQYDVSSPLLGYNLLDPLPTLALSKYPGAGIADATYDVAGNYTYMTFYTFRDVMFTVSTATTPEPPSLVLAGIPALAALAVRLWASSRRPSVTMA